MAYSQSFGLSRNSPLLNVEDEKNNPATSIVEKNNEKVKFDQNMSREDFRTWDQESFPYQEQTETYDDSDPMEKSDYNWNDYKYTDGDDLTDRSYRAYGKWREAKRDGEKYVSPYENDEPNLKKRVLNPPTAEDYLKIKQHYAIASAYNQNHGEDPMKNQKDLPSEEQMIENKKDDSWLTKAKTIVNNPFHSLKVAMAPGSNATFQSLKNLRQGIELANNPNTEKRQREQSKKDLSGSSSMNTISQFIPYAMAAQTAGDLASGDPLSAVLKKGKKLKPVYNFLKKNPFLKKIVTKGFLGSGGGTLYDGYKAKKHLKSI